MRRHPLRDAIGMMLLAAATGGASTSASGGYELPLIRVATTGGVVLAAERNARTLYVRLGSDGVPRTGDCALDWPPFLVRPDDFPTDGLSVVHRPDGSRQWSLGNWPLHFFIGDATRGEAHGDGIGRWRALRPALLGDTPYPGRASPARRPETQF